MVFSIIALFVLVFTLFFWVNWTEQEAVKCEAEVERLQKDIIGLSRKFDNLPSIKAEKAAAKMKEAQDIIDSIGEK